MSIYKQFKTSKLAEIEGIEIKFPKNEDGSIPIFLISRMSRTNQRYLKTMEAKTRPYRDEIDNKTISEELVDKLNLEIFCSAILLGWKNIKDENGNEISFTFDNSVKLMTELSDLYELLKEKSEKMENFLESKLQSEVKN